jgi:hypothetical protein
VFGAAGSGVSVTLSASDANDTLSGASAVSASASLSLTDQNDSLSASAQAGAAALLVAVDASDDLSSDAWHLIAGALSLGDADDVLSATVTTTGNADVVVQLDLTDEADSLAAGIQPSAPPVIYPTTLSRKRKRIEFGWGAHAPNPANALLWRTDDDDTLDAAAVVRSQIRPVTVDLVDDNDAIESVASVRPFPPARLIRSKSNMIRSQDRIAA